VPELIRLYIVNVIIGFAIAALFVALLLAFNVGNLGHLVSVSDKGVLAVILLWVAHGIVFAGVQFGIAVMGQKDDDDDDGPGGGLGQHVMRREHLPIRVRADEGKRPFWQNK